MVCIILNIVTMAMNYENAKPFYNLVLNEINYFFTACFIFESILKIIAYGIRGYFHKGWNKFDFFVVLTSVLDVIINQIGNSFIAFLKSGP